MPDRILLVGMMGAGKTSVGRRLATRLGWLYLDSDAQVEAATGRSVAEIFASDGEADFRRQERAALLDALSRSEPSVISVAGGAVLEEDNRRAIDSGGFTVWLRARVDTLARRVGDGSGRPLLGDDPAEALARLLTERQARYREVADAVVDVDDLSIDEVVSEILDRHQSMASA